MLTSKSRMLLLVTCQPFLLLVATPSERHGKLFKYEVVDSL